MPRVIEKEDGRITFVVHISLKRGLKLALVTLDPGIEMALQRDHDRPEKTVAHFWTPGGDHERAARLRRAVGR